MRLPCNYTLGDETINEDEAINETEKTITISRTLQIVENGLVLGRVTIDAHFDFENQTGQQRITPEMNGVEL